MSFVPLYNNFEAVGCIPFKRNGGVIIFLRFNSPSVCVFMLIPWRRDENGLRIRLWCLAELTHRLETIDD